MAALIFQLLNKIICEVLTVLNNLFSGILDSGTVTGIDAGDFLLCMASSLIIGVLLAFSYTYKNDCSKSFAVCLATLPAVVCVVIMMVSGSIGAGVAVAGTFSLVRFRSVPGTAKEICAIFLAMAAGLATGMGYIGFALLFSLIMIAANLILAKTGFGGKKQHNLRKTLRITIPEDLDYGGVFDDIFEEYTSGHSLTTVKTTNMGSLYRLTYRLTLRDAGKEKAFIDALRCRNGNLEISSSCEPGAHGVL